MKKVKTYISIALIGAMALSFTGCNMIKRTAASIGKTVLAEVGDKKITRADVDAELKTTLSQYKEQLKKTLVFHIFLAYVFHESFQLYIFVYFYENLK